MEILRYMKERNKFSGLLAVVELRRVSVALQHPMNDPPVTRVENYYTSGFIHKFQRDFVLKSDNLFN